MGMMGSNSELVYPVIAPFIQSSPLKLSTSRKIEREHRLANVQIRAQAES